MIHPLAKIRVGFLALATIVLITVVAFHTLAGYEWIDAIYMVVITISTVGYGEQSDAPAIVKLLSIATIGLGVSASAYTITGVVQILLEGEVDRLMGKRRMKKQINSLKDHTIVCGYGKSGLGLCERLEQAGHHFVVVDRDEERIKEATDHGYTTYFGDATDEDVLREVRIEDAASIVINLPTDAENVFITLSARNLCPNIRIVASAERESTSKKLCQAGANEVVLSHRMLADHMSRLVTRPSAAHFFDILFQAGNMELEIDELIVAPDSPLIGETISSSRIRDRHGLLIVGLRPDDGEFEFNPPADRKIGVDETMLVMGPADKINHFKDKNRLQDADPDVSLVVE